MKELTFHKELILKNPINQKKKKKNAWFVIIGILKILVINLKHISVKDGMVYQGWLKN